MLDAEAPDLELTVAADDVLGNNKGRQVEASDLMVPCSRNLDIYLILSGFQALPKHEKLSVALAVLYYLYQNMVDVLPSYPQLNQDRSSPCSAVRVQIRCCGM